MTRKTHDKQQLLDIQQLKTMRKWLWPPYPRPFYGDGSPLQASLATRTFVACILMNREDYRYVDAMLKAGGGRGIWYGISNEAA